MNLFKRHMTLFIMLLLGITVVFIDLSNLDSLFYKVLCSTFGLVFERTCPDFYDIPIWDFSIAFGALTAGILIDWFIRKQISKENKKRLLKNLKGDLKYNQLVNKEVKRVFKEYVINIAHNMYSTDGIRNFIYQRSFDDFESTYQDLSKLLILLQSSNKLLQSALFRVDNGQHVIVENSLKSNTITIEKMLNKILCMDIWDN